MKQFFKDDKGQDSSTRLIFIVGSIWNMFLSTYLVYKLIDTVTILAFFSGIQAVLIGLKLGQKSIEK